MKKLPSLLTLLIVGIAVGGCELYLDSSKSPDGHTSVCKSDGFYVDGVKQSETCPNGMPTGSPCADSNGCAAGCFCASGTCEEGGFCKSDADCPPEAPVCDDRSSCTPAQCTDNTNCAAGQICDGGRCVADPDPPTCNEAVTCTTARPACPAGQVALIDDGCYTGACSAIADCDIAPPCANITDEASCLSAAATCAASYTGHNCHTTGGTSCTQNSAGCTCDSFTFAACADRGTSGRTLMQDPAGAFHAVTSVQN